MTHRTGIDFIYLCGGVLRVQAAAESVENGWGVVGVFRLFVELLREGSFEHLHVGGVYGLVGELLGEGHLQVYLLFAV